MGNHIVSTSNILLEKLGDNILITVTLNTRIKDIGIENKNSVPTSPCNNQFPSETESTTLKSFLLSQLFLINLAMQEIKDSNHEGANSTYVAMFMEQIEYLKQENKGKNI